MNKAYGWAAVATAMAVCTGCVSRQGSAPQASLYNKVGTAATYDVLGDAKGSASGGVLFGFIPIGGDRQRGRLGMVDRAQGDEPFMERLIPAYALYKAFLSSANPVEAAALYNAIGSVPTADMLLMPRYAVERSNYIVYSEKTVTVKGKAIRLNPAAK